MKFINFIFYNIIFTLIHTKNSNKAAITNSSNEKSYPINNITNSIIKSMFPANENVLLNTLFISTSKITNKAINIKINSSIISNSISNMPLLIDNSTNKFLHKISNIKDSFIDYNISDKIIYKLYFLQVQLIEYQLKVYMLCDFEVPKDFTLLVNIIIYNNSLRFLEQNNKTVNVSYNNNYKNITEFIAKLNESDINENSEVEIMEINIQNTSEYQFIPKFGENIIKNTENFPNDINFTKILENKNYNFYKYEVEPISNSNNCSFNIKANTNISEQINNNLTLNLEEIDQKTEIYAECNFSYIYNNEIPCSLNSSEDIIQGRYILKENIYPEINELIHIIPANESMEFNIFCDMLSLKKDKIRSITTFEKSGNQMLSTGVIIIIIIVCIILVCIIIVFVGFLFINKNRMLNLMKGNIESEKNVNNEVIISSSTTKIG